MSDVDAVAGIDDARAFECIGQRRCDHARGAVDQHAVGAEQAVGEDVAAAGVQIDIAGGIDIAGADVTIQIVDLYAAVSPDVAEGNALAGAVEETEAGVHIEIAEGAAAAAEGDAEVVHLDVCQAQVAGACVG